tara:strand:+ start:134 stop:670 length:537 start_codon:yes stop_codon:yes gene_type:complete
MKNKLYYGNGECSIEGNVKSIEIKYSGAIQIYPKTPNGYSLIAGKNIIAISASPGNILNNLFDYKGEFKINAIFAYYNGSRTSCIIRRFIDYSEFLDTNAEDITRLSENINSETIYKGKISKTIIMDGIERGLHTSKTKNKLFLNNKPYKGYYHKHSDGTIMTGFTHHSLSKILTKGE